jgi:hypothetical protein
VRKYDTDQNKINLSAIFQIVATFGAKIGAYRGEKACLLLGQQVIYIKSILFLRSLILLYLNSVSCGQAPPPGFVFKETNVIPAANPA